MTNTIDFDFHTHTLPQSNCASQTVEELVKRVHSAGINTLAICNHDTISGLYEARVVCEKYGTEFVNGVELTCHILGEDEELDEAMIHILGINIDNDAELFNAYLADIRSQLHEVRFSYRHAIELIHKLNGIAVWAHPTRIYFHEQFSIEQIAKATDEMRACGRDGIEIFHPDNLKNGAIQSLLNIAESRDLKISLGSDLHNVENAYFPLNTEWNNFDYDFKKIKYFWKR